MRLSKVGWLQRFVLSFGGFWWGPPWWKMVDLHHLATDEVGWDRENVYWQFQESTTAIYPLRKGLSKTGLLQGFVLCFGGSDGGPMVTDGWYTSPGHRWGGLRQRNVSYQNYRKALPVSNHLEKGWAKLGCCRGMNTCLGTLMGPHGDRWLIGHLAADKVVPRPPPCPLASFVRWIVSAVNPFAIFKECKIISNASRA